MTQEEKELLLNDLCARLPYGVVVHAIIDGDNTLLGIYNDRVFTTCEEHGKHNDYPIECVKPYLRPMSSMTDEEYKEFSKTSGLLKNEDGYFSNHLPEWGNSIITERVMVKTIDWLNSHYFDYRGLIPMGLALEAPEGMYKGKLL